MSIEVGNPAKDLSDPWQRPTGLGWGFAAVSALLALFFFIKAQRVPPGFFSGGFEFAVAVLFALFATTAVVMLLLSWLLRSKFTGAAFAAAVVGIVCGLVPPTLTVTYWLMENLG